MRGMACIWYYLIAAIWFSVCILFITALKLGAENAKSTNLNDAQLAPGSRKAQHCWTFLCVLIVSIVELCFGGGEVTYTPLVNRCVAHYK